MNASQIGEETFLVGYDNAANDEIGFLSEATVVDVAVEKQVTRKKRHVCGLNPVVRTLDTLE